MSLVVTGHRRTRKATIEAIRLSDRRSLMNIDDSIPLRDPRQSRVVASVISRAEAKRHFDFSLVVLVPALIVTTAMAMTTIPARGGDRISIVFEVENAGKIERMTQPIRAVVERQLEAVRQANSAAAYDAVAPSLKKQFGSGEKYLRSFKAQLPRIAEGRIIDFGDLRETSFGYAQAVRISDARGEPWFALFLMDDVNGQWRISNIVAVKMPFEKA
jgi:hypothetical protein